MYCRNSTDCKQPHLFLPSYRYPRSVIKLQTSIISHGMTGAASTQITLSAPEVGRASLLQEGGLCVVK